MENNLADTLEQYIPILIEVATYVGVLGAIVEAKKYMDMKWYQVFFLMFKNYKQFKRAMEIRHRHDAWGRLRNHFKPTAQKG